MIIRMVHGREMNSLVTAIDASPRERDVHMHFPEPQKQCSCHLNDPPPWTGEIHGLSQVESLELPAITICPKVPDAFNATGLLGDIRVTFPAIDDATALDLVRFFIGGNGLENMDDLSYFNRTYMSHLNQLYKIWSDGYTTEEFFNLIQEKYGYACDELFRECQLAGKIMNCCISYFASLAVEGGVRVEFERMRYLSPHHVKASRTEADDIGRIILSLKAPPSITNPYYNYSQPQIIVYITDNFKHVVDFPRFYLYPHEWNRMRFTARYIALIENKDVCTQR
ncbi:hypothetical protein TELCIR_11613, partial [Teladorsagia circumcincta]